ncbi:MAG: hypothetical protein COA65_08970 [Rhodospirillaceae bacterium]|nr:MAG: hypothetical protein COA65_08970 [Rhodospirillaceae bacterium]
MIAALLAALKFAPAVMSAGSVIYEAVTGSKLSGETTPEKLADKVAALPEGKRADIIEKTLRVKARMQALDTERFIAMDGDAEKLRASARPEIARRAMGVIETFSNAIKILFWMTALEWLVRSGFALAGKPFPITDSIWDLVAGAAPVAEMIWAPLLASFWVCADVIKKYMGCRERDKSQEYEIRAGAPLNSSAATVEAAGGAVSNLIKAWKGR